MAPSATNGDAIAVLDDIKAPQGVVLPPKEIKGMAIHLHFGAFTDLSFSNPRKDRRVRRT